MVRYIIALLVTILVGHIAVAGVLSYRYWVDRELSDEDSALNQLTRFQEEKLYSLHPNTYETVFLGDSSLGYSIDARLFGKLAKTRSVSFALTGSHGHTAALIFLREITARKLGIKNVVLFFSVDGMGWGLNTEGRFLMDSWPVETALPLRGQIELLGVYWKRLTSGKDALSYLVKIFQGNLDMVTPESVYRDDYVLRHSKISDNSDLIRKYQLPVLGPDSSKYLQEIGRICLSEKLNCLYVQGPIMQELIHQNDAENFFYSAVSNSIKAAGIHLVNERPIPIAPADRGDSIFHISPNARDKFTQYYAGLIGPKLLKNH